MTMTIITLVLVALCFILTIYEVLVASCIYIEVMKLRRKRHKESRSVTAQEQTENDV